MTGCARHRQLTGMRIAVGPSDAACLTANGLYEHVCAPSMAVPTTPLVRVPASVLRHLPMVAAIQGGDLPGANKHSFVYARSCPFSANLCNGQWAVNKRIAFWARSRPCRKHEPVLGHVSSVPNSRTASSLKADTIVLAKLTRGQRARPTSPSRSKKGGQPSNTSAAAGTLLGGGPRPQS